MNKINILLLGAGKRLSLVERFHESAKKYNLNLAFYSIENTHDVPLQSCSNIIIGPKWADQEFNNFLSDTIDKFQIDIVLPLMDGAVESLAIFKESFQKECTIFVGSINSAYQLVDKELTNIFCDKYAIPRIPDSSSKFPIFVKPKKGFGSKGISILKNLDQLAKFKKENNHNNFLFQEYYPGEEFTFDCWVDDKEFFFSPRKRLSVSAGEVSTSVTVEDYGLTLIANNFLQSINWYGPLTFQVMKYNEELYLMEANGRLGGGVINSIESGFDICAKILSEHLHKKLKLNSRAGCKMMRANREVFKWV